MCALAINTAKRSGLSGSDSKKVCIFSHPLNSKFGDDPVDSLSGGLPNGGLTCSDSGGDWSKIDESLSQIQGAAWPVVSLRFLTKDKESVELVVSFTKKSFPSRPSNDLNHTVEHPHSTRKVKANCLMYRIT